MGGRSTSTSNKRGPGTAGNQKRPHWIEQLILIVVAAVSIVGGSFYTHSALHDSARLDAFHAAPVCPSRTAPTGNCVAWQQETVSSVSSPARAGTTLHLSANGQQLWFLNPQGWVASLPRGATVSILVWENQAQAIRQPDGVPLYADSSPALMGNDDTADAVCAFAFAVLMAAGLVGTSPLLRRKRPRLAASLAAVLADLGLSGIITGAIIQLTRSTLPGLLGGTILFSVVGLLVFGYRRQREERRRRAARLPTSA